MGGAEHLFSDGELRLWLDERRRRAVEEIRGKAADEVLARPPMQIAQEVIERYEISEAVLRHDEITGQVGDQKVDVAGDFRRAVFNRSGPHYVAGTRIALHVPYDGPPEVLISRASSYTWSPPQAPSSQSA